MKISQILLLSMLASGSALAEDNSEESVYASQLCHIVSSEKSVSTADQYVEKMKASVAGSSPPLPSASLNLMKSWPMKWPAPGCSWVMKNAPNSAPIPNSVNKR